MPLATVNTILNTTMSEIILFSVIEQLSVDTDQN